MSGSLDATGSLDVGGGTITQTEADGRYPANSISAVTISAESSLSAETLLSALFTSGTNAARPAAGVAGRQYLTTDNPRAHWLDSGSEWLALSAMTVTRTGDATARTNNTLADDDILIVPVKANTTYFIEAYIVATAANATMDIKFGWSVPASTTMQWGGFGGGTASIAGYGSQGVATTVVAIKGAANTLSIGTLAGTSGQVLAGNIFTSSTAGNVALQWAQDTTDAGDLKLLKGSVLRLTRLAG